MKSKLLKTISVSALTVFIAGSTATQALAWCGGGGGCWGYGGQGYYPPAVQERYMPYQQNYVQPQNMKQQNVADGYDELICDIQEVLCDQGYYDGEIDGLYGIQTKEALVKFQKDSGIPEMVDADAAEIKADETTLEALGLYEA